MLKIDNTLLDEIGLGGLPEVEKNSFLKHVYETLEMRVGIRLADQMTDQQLDEFEQYFEAKDDAGAFKWLEANFPNYKEIVQEEFDKLKAEVAQTAPQILAASQAAGAPTAGVPEGQVVPPAPQQPYAPQPEPIQYAQPAPQQYAAPQAAPAPDPAYQPQQAPAPAQPYAAPPQPAPIQQSQFQQPQPQQPVQPWQPPQPTQDAQQYQPPYPNQQPPAGSGQ